MCVWKTNNDAQKIVCSNSQKCQQISTGKCVYEQPKVYTDIRYWNVSKESQESVCMKSQLNTLIAASGAEYCVCKKDYRKKIRKIRK